MDISGTATRAKPKPLNPLIIAAINTIIPLIPIVMIVNSIIRLSPSLVWSSCMTFIALKLRIL